jgi:hypothetical protein
VTVFQEFMSSQAGQLLGAMVIVAFVDFLTGSFAALRDGTFTLDALAAFLRKHVAGRVAPIALLLVVGYFGGDVIGQLFMASAVASALAYVAETGASVLGNLNPPKGGDVQAAVNPAAIINPVPKD